MLPLDHEKHPRGVGVSRVSDELNLAIYHHQALWHQATDLTCLGLHLFKFDFKTRLFCIGMVRDEREYVKINILGYYRI